MAIRNTAKALLLHENRILVNKCAVEETGEIYYDLPGGGQHQFETMEEAVVREVMEETGYEIKVLRFAALAEEIYDDEDLRKRYYDYSHRVLHIFLAELAGDRRQQPSEVDFQQEESLWMPVEEADQLPFRPPSLSGKLGMIIGSRCPLYLGSVRE